MAPPPTVEGIENLQQNVMKLSSDEKNAEKKCELAKRMWEYAIREKFAKWRIARRAEKYKGAVQELQSIKMKRIGNLGRVVMDLSELKPRATAVEI